MYHDHTKITESSSTRRFRSIFISDTHLGFNAARVDLLVDFLRHHDADLIYLVGDFIDFWELERKFRWTEECSAAVRIILEKSEKNGTDVFYIPGNHDAILRGFLTELSVNGIVFENEVSHSAVNGKKYLVVHGDLFDSTTKAWEMLSRLGNRAYEVSIQISRGINWVRHKFGLGHWSLSHFLKHNVKKAQHYVNKFEEHMVDYCHKKGFDGVICGHIHTAEMRDMNGLDYMNIGDFIESFTVLVEDFDGSWELLRWPTVRHQKSRKETGKRPDKKVPQEKILAASANTSA